MQVGETLAHTTVRLLVRSAAGFQSGTGFLLAYVKPSANRIFCVTNRHVMEGAISCELTITLDSGSGVPNYSNVRTFTINNVQNATIYHPDPKIDLAAFSIVDIINHIAKSGEAPFLRLISRGEIPELSHYAEFDIATDIVMIGYPSGLADIVNNMPLVRRGILATSPALNFNGNPDFVVDCACFPGSSGSPVFVYQPHGYLHNGSYKIGQSRIVLIGILHSGPTVDLHGQIVSKPVPTAVGTPVRSEGMMHLGYCVRATELSFIDAKGWQEITPAAGPPARP